MKDGRRFVEKCGLESKVKPVKVSMKTREAIQALYAQSDAMIKAGAVMEAYKTLITHPGFTLKDVQRKVSGIRAGINGC